MQGILVGDKPEGFTSFDVVAKRRGICGTRRIGQDVYKRQYCAIPLIRGPLRSRTIPDIVAEARFLAGEGVQELIVVAQDITEMCIRDRH